MADLAVLRDKVLSVWLLLLQNFKKNKNQVPDGLTNTDYGVNMQFVRYLIILFQFKKECKTWNIQMKI